MKKLTFLILCLIFLSCTALGLIGCKNQNGQGDSTTHIHSFSEQKAEQRFLATAATCTEMAKYYYSCSCGESEHKDTHTFTSGDALGHSFTDYIPDNNATCLQDGTKTAICSHCDATDTIADDGSKLPHMFYNEIVAEEYFATAANCTKAAEYYYSCECGEKGTQTFANGKALGHTFGEWYTVNGKKIRKCMRSGCDYFGTESQGLKYEVDSNNISCKITGIGSCSDIDITIPEEINGYKVTSIGDDAFSDCDRLTSITISDSVTNIGERAFSCCYSLTDITIPNDIACIGRYAFTGCYNLEYNEYDNAYYLGNEKNPYVTLMHTDFQKSSYKINEKCRIVYFQAFWGCDKLTSIIIPDSVIAIGYQSFYGCNSLTSISIPFVGATLSGTENTYFGYIFGADYWTSIEHDYPNSLKTVVIKNKSNTIFIGDEAFRFFRGLTSVTIDGNVSSIGEGAFYCCSKLTNVTISDSVTSIDAGAFAGCSSLTSITLPDSITSIGNGVFTGCSLLTNITIPKGVPSIDNAFSGCSSLTSITIPDSVTSINGAFRDCSSLSNITIPFGVTSISWMTFSGCSSLTSIIIPDSVTSIDDAAFSGCSSLTSVTIGEGVTSIGSDAFADCGNLSSITIPIGVKSMGGTVFANCIGLTEVLWNAEDCAELYGGSFPIFSGCDNITQVTIGENTKNLNAFSFSGCSNLTSVTIGSKVSSISFQAFDGCNNLKNIFVSPKNSTYRSNGNCLIKTSNKTLTLGFQESVIPTDGSVTSIGDYAFANCISLASITIPDSVVSIGDSAFEGCNGLTSLILENGLSSIGWHAFANCTEIISITIPESVTSIGQYAFKNCSKLTEISWNAVDCEEDIGCFNGCDNITKLTIGENVRALSDYPFSNITGLENITVSPKNSIYYDKDDCLIDKDNKTLVLGCKNSIIPSDGSVTFIGFSAFANCVELTSLTIPDNITGIGNSAFWGCIGLVNISIPKSVTFIGNDVFYGCSSLTSIVIPNNITDINGSIFEGCISLTNVIIGNGVKVIYSCAFRNCTSLATITFSGTMNEWTAIKKCTDWEEGVPTSCKIICSDGEMSL